MATNPATAASEVRGHQSSDSCWRWHCRVKGKATATQRPTTTATTANNAKRQHRVVFFGPNMSKPAKGCVCVLSFVCLCVCMHACVGGCCGCFTVFGWRSS